MKEILHFLFVTCPVALLAFVFLLVMVVFFLLPVFFVQAVRFRSFRKAGDWMDVIFD